MKALNDILKLLVQSKPVLLQTYPIQALGVFGSYVRGEQRADSDVDILVEFREPIGLFKFVELELTLSTLLGVKVDLVMKSALKPRIGQQILSEVIDV